MASPEVISELLRQAFQQRNQPSQFMQGVGQIQQVLQGVSQGIQLYDQVKGLKDKEDKTVSVPGSPAVPASPAQPPLVGSTPGNVALPNFNSGTTPGFPTPGVGGLGQVGQPTPATFGSPATPPTLATQLGTDSITNMKNLAEISPDLLRMQAALKGVNIGETTKEINTVRPIITVDKDGKQTVSYVQGAKPTVIDQQNSVDKQGYLKVKQQQLALETARLQESTKEFYTKLGQEADEKKKADIEKFMSPFLKGLNNPKIAQDKQAVSFANDMMQEYNQTGQVPEVKIEDVKKFGFIPWGQKATVVRSGGNTPPPNSPVKTIRVRKKSTGETGSINESDFNSSMYEKL